MMAIPNQLWKVYTCWFPPTVFCWTWMFASLQRFAPFLTDLLRVLVLQWVNRIASLRSHNPPSLVDKPSSSRWNVKKLFSFVSVFTYQPIDVSYIALFSFWLHIWVIQILTWTICARAAEKNEIAKTWQAAWTSLDSTLASFLRNR